MCLATVYKESDDTIICRNVSKILVEGDTVIIRDIMGAETTVQGSILMVDLANSIVKLKCD
ncbi:MAG: CooT family nickel-binding protein [Clostridiales bacterium]|nr:CooT family nickel-binding protein [Clostridiales bacterium]